MIFYKLHNLLTHLRVVELSLLKHQNQILSVLYSTLEDLREMLRLLNQSTTLKPGDQIEIKENRFTVGDIDQFERTKRELLLLMF